MSENNKKKKKNKKVNLDGLLILGFVFCAVIAILILVQANVRYSVREEKLDLYSQEELIKLKQDSLNSTKEKSTVLMVTGDDPVSLKAQKVFIPMLDQMKVPYDICDVEKFDYTMLEDYETLVLLVTQYQLISKHLLHVKNWVRDGGNLMIAYPPETSGSFESLFDVLGIKDGPDASLVEGIHIKENFMIGGNLQDFYIEEPYDSSFGVVLSNDCDVFIESTGDYPVPILWRRKYGEGTVVFDNFGIMEKAYRGIHSTAFSLTGDYCIYPVINSATFYIDDFPSPVPQGDAQYITRDYNMSISDFYSQVWWRNVYDLSRKYDIDYTGLVIENYNNQVKGKFERNKEISRFQYFGNMLLKSGGEIGIHGYNHMPLVLENFDYKDEFDEYIQWPSTENMRDSMDECFDFTESLFPDEDLNVYVPPSNILSEEGREILATKNIRAIAAVYLGKDMAYEQEFEINTKDGIIDTPRIVSGYNLDDYMMFAAFSELNFHLVSTHFQHPDDVLDEDRGAALGWETLYTRFDNYLDWLYTSCPQIRNLTGSELAGAVQRYDLLGINREQEDNKIVLELENFNDEAWLALRLNEGQVIKEVIGGEYSSLADNLYLIECDTDKVEILFEQ